MEVSYQVETIETPYGVACVYRYTRGRIADHFKVIRWGRNIGEAEGRLRYELEYIRKLPTEGIDWKDIPYRLGEMPVGVAYLQEKVSTQTCAPLDGGREGAEEER